MEMNTLNAINKQGARKLLIVTIIIIIGYSFFQITILDECNILD